MQNQQLKADGILFPETSHSPLAGSAVRLEWLHCTSEMPSQSNTNWNAGLERCLSAVPEALQFNARPIGLGTGKASGIVTV